MSTAFPEPAGRRAQPLTLLDELIPGNRGLWDYYYDGETQWAVTADGTLYALSGGDDAAHTGRPWIKASHPAFAAGPTCIHVDGDHLLIASGLTLLRVGVETLSTVSSFPLPVEPVGVTTVADDVWVASADGTLRRFSAAGDLLGTIDVGEAITGLAYDGGKLYTIQAKVAAQVQAIISVPPSGGTPTLHPHNGVRIFRNEGTAYEDRTLIRLTYTPSLYGGSAGLEVLTSQGEIGAVYLDSVIDIGLSDAFNDANVFPPGVEPVDFSVRQTPLPPIEPIELDPVHGVYGYGYFEDTPYTEQIGPDRWVSVFLASTYLVANDSTRPGRTPGAFDSALLVYVLDTSGDQISIVADHVFFWTDLFGALDYPYAHSFARLRDNAFVFVATDYLPLDLPPGEEGYVSGVSIAFEVVDDQVHLISADIHPYDMEFGFAAGGYEGRALWFHHSRLWQQTFGICTEFRLEGHYPDTQLVMREAPFTAMIDDHVGGGWSWQSAITWGTDPGPCGAYYLGNDRWAVTVYGSIHQDSWDARLSSSPARMFLLVVDMAEQRVVTSQEIFDQYSYGVAFNVGSYGSGWDRPHSMIDRFWPIADFAKSVNHMARRSDGLLIQTGYRYRRDGQEAQYFPESLADQDPPPDHQNWRGEVLAVFFRVSADGEIIEVVGEHDFGSFGDEWFNGAEFGFYPLGLFNCHGMSSNDEIILLPVSHSYMAFDWGGVPRSAWAWYPHNRMETIQSSVNAPFDQAVNQQQTHKWPERIDNRVLVFSYDWWEGDDPIFSWQLFGLDGFNATARPPATRFRPETQRALPPASAPPEQSRGEFAHPAQHLVWAATAYATTNPSPGASLKKVVQIGLLPGDAWQTFGLVQGYQIGPTGYEDYTTPVGVAYGDGHVWIVDPTGFQDILKLDESSQQVVGSLPDPTPGGGSLAWSNEGLWVSSPASSIIYRIDPSTGLVNHTIAVGGNVNAITWDGEYLWAAWGHNGAGQDSIYKLTPDGTAVHSFVNQADSYPTYQDPVNGLMWIDGDLFVSTQRWGCYRTNPVTGDNIEQVFRFSTTGMAAIPWGRPSRTLPVQDPLPAPSYFIGPDALTALPAPPPPTSFEPPMLPPG